MLQYGGVFALKAKLHVSHTQNENNKIYNTNKIIENNFFSIEIKSNVIITK